MSFELAKVNEVFVDFKEQIKEAKIINEQTVFDYEDKKGNKEARSHIYKLRQSRSAIEKVRKAEKAESLAYGKELDSVAKTLTSELTEMIEVHEAPIKAIEEREKAIQAEIWEIAEAKNLEYSDTPEIQAKIESIENTVINEETFGAFVDEAEFEKFKTLKELVEIRESFIANDLAEIERVRVEQEKADAIQAEADKQAEIARKEREKQIEEKAKADAIEKAKQREIQVEQEKQQALAKAEQDKKDAVAKAEREAQTKIDAERQRIADEKAQADKEKYIADQAEAARKANIENCRKINGGILQHFQQVGCGTEVAKNIIGQIAKGNIANIQINY